MKLLRFHTTDETTRRVPDRQTEVTDLNAAGKAFSKIDVQSWKIEKDASKFSKITIFSEDAGIYSAALRWRIGDDGEIGEGLESSFPEVAPAQSETMQIEIRGNFESAPSPYEIHEICEDYLLLASKYPTYKHITSKPLSPQIIEAILNHLLDEGENLLPSWISQVLALRKGEAK